MSFWKKIVAFFADGSELGDATALPLDDAARLFADPAQPEDRRERLAKRLASLSDELGALDSEDRAARGTELARVLGSALADERVFVRQGALKGLNETLNVARNDMAPDVLAALQPPIGRLSGDPEPSVRSAVCGTLAALCDSVDEPAKRSIVAVLGPLTRDTDTSVRDAAIFGLAVCGEVARPFLDQVDAWLADPSDDIRSSAASFLRMVGETDVPSHRLNRLLAMLSTDTSPRVRETVADTLGRVGRNHAGAVVTALVSALRDRASDVRHKSIFALGDLGDQAERAVPELARLLDDPEHREAATFGLRGVGTESARRMLLAKGISPES